MLIMTDFNTTIQSVTDVKPKRRMSFGKKALLFLSLGIVLYLVTIYVLGAVFVYSDGDRTGYIYKFSKKGYIFKTHEGILKTGFVNIGNTSTPNEEWEFSVADDKIAAQLRALDQRAMVKLHYKQHYTKLFWRGDTKYFVYKIETMTR
jgi:hypothetical protein